MSQIAQIDSWTSHLHNVDTTGKNPTLVPSLSAFEVIFQNILAIVVTGAGLACFVMLLVGGFKYLTAGGDQKATAAAKQTLTWAIMGLVVLIGAWFILSSIGKFTGQKVLELTIPTPAP